MNQIIFDAVCYSEYVYETEVGMIYYVDDHKVLLVDDEVTNTLYVVFRGSYNVKNWMRDFQFYPAYRSYAGYVHNGFADSVDLLSPLVSELIDNMHKSQKIVFCGHSLGGSIAQLFGQKFLNLNPLVVTIGSPRTYNRFSMTKKPAHIRIINNEDPVPKFLYFFYKHFQTELITIYDKNNGWIDPLDHSSERYVKKLSELYPNFIKPYMNMH